MKDRFIFATLALLLIGTLSTIAFWPISAESATTTTYDGLTAYFTGATPTTFTFQPGAKWRIDELRIHRAGTTNDTTAMTANLDSDMGATYDAVYATNTFGTAKDAFYDSSTTGIPWYGNTNDKLVLSCPNATTTTVGVTLHYSIYK